MLPMPAWIDAVFVALVAALGGLLLLGLRYGRAGLEMAARARGPRLLVAGAGLGAWLAVTGALAGRAASSSTSPRGRPGSAWPPARRSWPR